jgi:glycosyltransferase involved in cell wall biosynthesis
MKLLIVTQKIDKEGGYFSFFHDWLAEFAKQCESVIAIGLEVGTYDLPKNVKVYSLGKETKKSRLQYLRRLLSYSWKERNNYDAVLAHMSPLYVIFGFPVWKSCGKKIGMWYVHKHVDFKLHAATILTDVVFSAVPESFRIKTKKVRFMGQAVPLEAYRKPKSFTAARNAVFTIVSVGRITPIKNLDTLIEAAVLLSDKRIALHVDLIGEPVKPGDIDYKQKLVKLIAEKKLENTVSFAGKVSDINLWFWKSDLSVNLCPTGGLDKAVLESMAAETPVMVSNEAFREYFGKYRVRMMFKERDPADLARKLEAFIGATDKKEVTRHLLEEVGKRSSLRALIGRIVEILSK